MKHLIALMLMGSSIGVAHAQKLEIVKSEYEIATGQTASFIVNLKEARADSYNAITISMLMPNGHSLVDNPKLTDKFKNPFCVTQENFILPTNPESYESLMFYGIGDIDQDRNIKMAFASSDPLPGTEVNDLLKFAFTIDADLVPDLYLIKLQNIKFEYEPNGKDNANDVTVRVRVYKLGDANKDDIVSTADATVLINHILNRESAVPYNEMLADMNEDQVIDIFDVMKLKYVILHGKLPEKKLAMARAAANGFYEDMTLSYSGNGVTMGIPNAQRFTSFQFDVEVPDDIELSAAKLIGMTTNHSVEFAKIDDNYYRVIGLSMDNSLLEGNNGNNLIGLEIPNCGKLSIHNAMFVSPLGEITHFNDTEIESGITGIRPIITSDSESVYDLLGRKVQMKNGRLPKGIYIINNKRVIIK